MPSLTADREIREVVDPKKRGARNVALEVALAARFNAREVVPAVDELVPAQ
jgi:hypothetical protein